MPSTTAGRGVQSSVTRRHECSCSCSTPWWTLCCPTAQRHGACSCQHSQRPALPAPRGGRQSGCTYNTRQLLGVRQSTPSAVVLMEAGVQPPGCAVCVGSEG
jgi:hypothetical protein